MAELVKLITFIVIVVVVILPTIMMMVIVIVVIMTEFVKLEARWRRSVPTCRQQPLGLSPTDRGLQFVFEKHATSNIPSTSVGQSA